jgi:hypothetical protein
MNEANIFSRNYRSKVCIGWNLYLRIKIYDEQKKNYSN